MARVCAEPGCPTLTEQTRCERHRKAKRRQEDKRRPNARQRGYDTQWSRFRAQFLRDHPICGWHQGCLAQATDVHHLDGQGPKGERGYDPSNCLQLCGPHHSMVTAREQRGGWNA
jgi:5-methylcytosine-specific restriction protein A